MQKGAPKDVERAFDVFQSWWRIVKNPYWQWDLETIIDIMMTCIVLHNMIKKNSTTAIQYQLRPSRSMPSKIWNKNETHKVELKNRDIHCPWKDITKPKYVSLHEKERTYLLLNFFLWETIDKNINLNSSKNNLLALFFLEPIHYVHLPIYDKRLKLDRKKQTNKANMRSKIDPCGKKQITGIRGSN